MKVIVDQKPAIRVVAAKARGPVRVAAHVSSVVVKNAGRAGPQGLPGVPGPVAGIVHEQLSPSASWIITHTLGRLPSVTVYHLDGEEVEADVFVTTTQVNIVFPFPTTGRAVIN